MNELEKEKQYLKNVIVRFKELIDEYEINIDQLPLKYKEEPYLLEQFLIMYSNKVKMLEKLKEKPYFARIDFKSDRDSQISECYLSKVGIEDKSKSQLTVDWRAPIASVYYDSNVGRCSYEAPDGVITGNLLLKRQYEIKNSQLLNFRDVDTVSNDDMLKPYLNVNADSRLKNIIASIQSEQNNIIREKMTKNLIVQGVAGSGKTTVALHRVAYLLYNYIESIKPEQYLVIGPNKFFINYISAILPDLDAPNFKQLTYDEFVKSCLKEKFTYFSSDDNLVKSISDVEKNQLFFEKLKTSMVCKNALDEFMNDYMNSIFGGRDFEINNYKIINGDSITKIYENIKDDFLYKESHKKKIDRIMLLMGSYIENHQAEIISSVWKQYLNKIENLDLNARQEEKEKYQMVKKEVEKNCKTSIKKYFSKSTPKILSLYLEFLNNIYKYIDVKEYDIKVPVENNIKNVKKKRIEFEDLSALLYLKYKLQEPEDLQKFKHVVIDEAQDLGEFNFYALKQMLSNSTFSIFGDMTQSIYQYRGIKDWDSVINKVFAQNCDMKYLLKSYRTTTEIMNSANIVASYIGMEKSEPVIRHGDEVEYVEIHNNQLEEIVDKINNGLKKNYKSIAIITKTEDEANNIYRQLNKIGINVENINLENNKYTGGICTIPSYLSKGLEFDSVIITDASENQYSSNKIIDMKLLYVAMTRALHELTVLYNENITLPLNDNLRKDNTLKKVR